MSTEMTGRCPVCGHDIARHFREPSCVACDRGCNLDPVCDACGELASKHEDDWRCPQ